MYGVAAANAGPAIGDVVSCKVDEVKDYGLILTVSPDYHAFAIDHQTTVCDTAILNSDN